MAEASQSTGEAAPARGGSKAAGNREKRDGACGVPKCKQPIRAKGFCRKHYMAWRRGAAGKHQRYKVCTKEGCRKPRERAGFCAEHAKGGAAAEAAA